MNLQNYLKNEMVKTKVLNENTAEAGDCSVFEGSQWMGPHHHQYVIFDNLTGQGYTGDVLIDNPDHKEGLAPVCDHIHLIVNWEVLPLGDGHTHKLEKPIKVQPDTDIGLHTVPVEVVKDNTK
ncbi:MAG: hypothetical protein J6T10_04150 [Methanobrevibacter sp.]|nr:hypothetical protein [Methanobrevibacter sp.]